MNIWLRRILGVFDLGGGFLGLTLCASVLVQPASIVTKLFLIPFLLLYCWGIWSGLRTLEDSKNAARMNFGYWAIQIPYFMSPIAGYLFTSGAFLFFVYEPGISKTSLTMRFGSQFQFSFLEGKPFQLGINCFAVVVCILVALHLYARSRTPTAEESSDQNSHHS